MGEKLTREEWEAYIALHRRVIELAQVGHHEDCFLVPVLTRTPTISVYTPGGVFAGRVDMARVIHDPERDRANLIARLETTIAEAGPAGEGLRVVEGEPEKPTTDATVILRPTGEVDVYSLHGGGHEGEWVKWMPSREFAICYPGGKTWTAERLVLFDSQTVLADGDECEDITAYLAAIPGDWRLEGE